MVTVMKGEGPILANPSGSRIAPYLLLLNPLCPNLNFKETVHCPN